MASPENPLSSAYTAQLLDDLRQTQHMNGIGYSNVLLTTTESGFNDAYDPDVQLDERGHVSLYWPDGHPESGFHYESVNYGELDTAGYAREATLARNVILGASISETTYARKRAASGAYWESVKDFCSIPPIALAIGRCGEMGLPLAVCWMATIVQSKLAAAGERVAFLWFPKGSVAEARTRQFEKSGTRGDRRRDALAPASASSTIHCGGADMSRHFGIWLRRRHVEPGVSGNIG